MRSAIQYQPDRDQLALAAELEAPLAALLPIARLHRAGGGEDESTWRALSELGLLAATLDEARGGSGLGATELALIAIELGRNLASPAVFATMIALGAAKALASPSDSPRIAAAFPVEDSIWIDEPGANLLLARTDGGAALHAMPARPRVADVGTWGPRLMTGDIGPCLGRLGAREVQLMRLLDGAALAGIAEATLVMAVDYAKTREQFSRPIGSFQAIKHHCATMAIAARSARDLTTFAAVAIDTGRADALHRTESAFLVAAQAAIDNAGANIQIHGGIGFSAEAHPHLFLKRARLIAALGGGAEAAGRRVVAAHQSNDNRVED
ncbi:MAG TPA: acyl-CoA dehydrogenase [Caulobacteraceae bacterium]